MPEINVAPQHDILFWVDPETGELVMKVEGVTGKGCEGLLDILKDISVVSSEEHTDDWERPEPQGRSVRTRTSAKTGSY